MCERWHHWYVITKLVKLLTAKLRSMHIGIQEGENDCGIYTVEHEIVTYLCRWITEKKTNLYFSFVQSCTKA